MWPSDVTIKLDLDLLYENSHSGLDRTPSYWADFKWQGVVDILVCPMCWHWLPHCLGILMDMLRPCDVTCNSLVCPSWRCHWLPYCHGILMDMLRPSDAYMEQSSLSMVLALVTTLSWDTRVSNSYDQPQLPPTKMATAENGETKQSRISGKPDRALCPYDTDMTVSYHTMYFSYDHVF